MTHRIESAVTIYLVLDDHNRRRIDPVNWPSSLDSTYERPDGTLCQCNNQDEHQADLHRAHNAAIPDINEPTALLNKVS